MARLRRHTLCSVSSRVECCGRFTPVSILRTRQPTTAIPSCRWCRLTGVGLSLPTKRSGVGALSTASTSGSRARTRPFSSTSEIALTAVASRHCGNSRQPAQLCPQPAVVRLATTHFVHMQSLTHHSNPLGLVNLGFDEWDVSHPLCPPFPI